MSDFVSCFVFFALITFCALFAFLVALAHKIRVVQRALEKLNARVVQLEARPRVSETVPAPAPAPTAPMRTTEPVAPVIAPIVKPAPAIPKRTPPTPAVPRAAINWEAFLGVKLFAWIGGFVLFLGVVFLVKYSFENNLITPFMRVVIGAIIGCGLVAAGWFTARRNYRVPGQSLCATGVLILYADIFGAHAFYELISLTTAFSLMSVVTLTAFVLAVRLDAQVVVVLGLVGGFLTPPLLNTAPESALRLFGYIALLNLGLAAVALRKRWDYLLLLGALGTVITEVGWLHGHEIARAVPGFVVFLALEALFLAFAYLRQRKSPAEKWSTPAAATVGFAAFIFALWMLALPGLAGRPAFFFSFIFLADLGLLLLAVMRPNPSRLAASAGAVVFGLLAAWTGEFLTHDLLWWALAAYLVFALMHAGFSVWPAAGGDAKPTASSWPIYVPLLALGLLFICVWNGETSFAVWACVLLVDLVALGLAWTRRSVGALVVALLATLVTAGLWIALSPPLNASIGGMLSIVAGFGLFFSTAATLLARKLVIGENDLRRNVPAISAAMPFVLLLMLIAKLPIAVPTAVFAVALLLAVVLLGLGILSRSSWTAAVALAFTWVVECEWHTLHFQNTHALIAIGWYVLFLLLFIAYPFFSSEENASLPWIIGALSGLLHFGLINDSVALAYPGMRNGLLPAAFILPYAFGLFFLVRKRAVLPSSGDARLAWQGGAALFFLSLIFPIQFEREWVTLGWAFEGLALLWLFRVVPNQGLRVAGAGLLSISFVRLALNQAVFEYHPRSSQRIWNWYLYAYGLTCLCLFGGARLLHQFRETRMARVVPRLLYTLGTILTFLLLNIEIADYFSVGPTLTFSFSGNFARDMTYSIAWALFAFALLLVGMKKELRFVRYAGLGLLLITLLKLFLHDLGELSQLYRIGAFIGVALILIIASFVYQRFLRPARGELEGDAQVRR